MAEVHPPQPMPCPGCSHGPVAPHPESTAVVGLYACPVCRQEWTARFHDPDVTVTITDGTGDPKTVTTTVHQLNTAFLERLR